MTEQLTDDPSSELQRLRELASLVREYDAEWAAAEAGAPDHRRRADIRRRMFELVLDKGGVS